MTVTLVQHQLRILHATLPLAAMGDGDAVHRGRVASRRLREVLPAVVARRAVDGLNGQARRLTRALGPVRELDVTLGLLARYAETRAVTPRAAAALKRVLVAQRAQVRLELARRLGRFDLAKFEKAVLAEVRRKPRLGDVDARLSARARVLQEAIEAAAGLYVPDRLHAVRIAVKRLRYAEEVREVARGGAPSGGRLRLLSRAQDALGRMHDLDVLAGAIRRLQGADDPPSLGVCADLDAFVRVLDGECRQLHGQYMRLRDRLLDVCAGRSGTRR